MKRFALYIGIVVGLVASCSTKEIDFQTPVQDDVVFYASFERPSDIDTRVYANEDLLLRWTGDDRVSIFEKNTRNQQYRFTGETGDNAGEFDKVAGSGNTTGNAISHIVSVYPYQESTKISMSETITITLPAGQHYAGNTFGLGANTMVSVTSNNFLQYKNVCGYLVVKLYGDGVSVSSITLRGNNGEKLAGKATVTMPLEGVPTTTMANDATSEITLSCATPVQLSATAEESTQFWFVVPPVTFSKGFTITVSGNGGVFEKNTGKTVTIQRNNLSRISPVEVVSDHDSVFVQFENENFKAYCVENFDSDGDGEVSYAEAKVVTRIDVRNKGISSLKGIESFINLTYLDCSSKSFSNSPNQLTSLDVSQNTALTVLKCSSNQLKSLDVSHNTALKELWCSSNQLKSLDVSHNTALELLYCNSNPTLSEIWLKTGQTIRDFLYDTDVATIKYKD
jgi:hypothetical protein